MVKTQNLSECERLCCSLPRSNHHIDEEWEQVIHAPQEVAVQHGIDFLGQLLKGLLDDDEFVRWSKGGAARDILSLKQTCKHELLKEKYKYTIFQLMTI